VEDFVICLFIVDDEMLIGACIECIIIQYKVNIIKKVKIVALKLTINIITNPQININDELITSNVGIKEFATYEFTFKFNTAKYSFVFLLIISEYLCLIINLNNSTDKELPT
jgi:hypothetical protein